MDHADIVRLQQLDAEHHLHPFNDNAALAKKGTRILVKGEGAYVWDAEGHKLLDAFAGLWCVNLGYGRPELGEAARRQMDRLAYYNSFFQCTVEPTIELSAKLAELTPGDLDHAFFTNSGSEANDTILRLVRHFWAVQDKPEKNIFIGRHNGYHGTTMAGASLGGVAGMHRQGGLPIPDIHHIDPPFWFADGGDLSPEEYGLVAARRLEAKILELGPERVAAFIGEPIMGAIGVYIPPMTYWPEIERICRRYDVLLVADEVICGFGRTGEWFGSQYYDLQPDLMTIAKGLTSGYVPMGGLIVSDKVFEVIEAHGDFNHGFTYSGHPVAAAVGLENLRILKEEGIVERVKAQTAPYLLSRLRELADHPLVGEVRGIGMLGAIELVQDKASRKRYPSDVAAGMVCRGHCFNNGLIMRAVGDTMIIAPPLVISPAEIDELLEKARKCLDLTLRDLSV